MDGGRRVIIIARPEPSDQASFKEDKYFMINLQEKMLEAANSWAQLFKANDVVS